MSPRKKEMIGTGTIHVRCVKRDHVAAIDVYCCERGGKDMTEDSGVQVTYTSSSYGQVEISKMHDKHILNSYRKLQKAIDNAENPIEAMKQVHGPDAVLKALYSEIITRGMDPRYERGYPLCQVCVGTGYKPGSLVDGARQEYESRCDACLGRGVIKPEPPND